MVNARTLVPGAIGSLLILGVFFFALFRPGGQQRLMQRQREIEKDIAKITDPMTSSVRNFNPVSPPKTRARISRQSPAGSSSAVKSVQTPRPAFASLTILAAEAQPEKPSPEKPRGEFAPAFRLVKCQLVNTVDSSNITTPIIGLVTDDVWWNGKVIIRANSEVHAVANIDRLRERIASNGEFTFVLNEPNGLGRELVIKAMALDMEKDNQMDSYGITDGSAGLRGDVIRTANADVIKLYAASLISGVAGAFSTGTNGILGNRVFTNNASLGLSALQGGVINPAAGGTQSVLDRYAEQIASSIEREGFFVRVPAGKQFYVYCTEAIDLAKAKVAADDERVAREDADFKKQQERSEVRRALPVNACELLNPLLPAIDLLNNSKK